MAKIKRGTGCKDNMGVGGTFYNIRRISDSGGQWAMETIQVKDGKVEKIEISTPNLYGVIMGRLLSILQEGHR